MTIVIIFVIIYIYGGERQRWVMTSEYIWYTARNLHQKKEKINPLSSNIYKGD